MKNIVPQLLLGSSLLISPTLGHGKSVDTLEETLKIPQKSIISDLTENYVSCLLDIFSQQRNCSKELIDQVTALSADLDCSYFINKHLMILNFYCYDAKGEKVIELPLQFHK